MSSSKYTDSRYVRERSPFRDRRQSAYGSTYPPRANDGGPRSNVDSSGFPPRDTPRGPKLLVDTPRGPPSGGPSGTPSSRGRGFGSRGETPSLRDAPPLSSAPHPHNSWRASDRDRDRDFDSRDRRDRRPSPPRRSPVRDSRDNRDQRDFPPRDLDIGRARRNSRDGPLSAGSTYSDPPFNTGSSYRGSGFGRGRGGRDFHGEGRGRGRPMYPDDRDRHHDARDRMLDRSYRPRSRSRDPVRRPDRDLRDERDRDFDRRERERDERRFVPREYDSYIGPAGAKPGPRALDTHRGSATLDSRHLPGTPTGAAPHSIHHSPADRHGPPVDSYSRRASIATEALGNKDTRREPGRDDLLLAGRAEASRERYAPRASSPPAAVPAFGSNVWRNPLLDAKPAIALQPPKPPQPTPTSSVPSIPVTAALTSANATAPKQNVPAGLSTAPPTGPKADRSADRHIPDGQPQSQGLSQAQESRPASSEQSRMEARPSLAPPAPSNNGSPSSSNVETKPLPPTSNSAPNSAISPPAGPTASSRFPPMGPQGPFRANISPSFPRPTRLPYMSNPRDPSPGAMPPAIGSRSGSGSGTAMLSNTSPKTLPANIPTGPKADRGNPMAARQPMYPPSDRSGFPPSRMSNGPPKSMQWVRPGLNMSNRTTIPTKREFPAEDRDRAFGTPPKAPKLEANITAPESQRTEKAKSDSPSINRPSMERDAFRDRRTSGDYPKAISPKPTPIETRRFSNVSMTEAPSAPEKPPISATSSAPEVLQDSDDDLDLDEDDFAESEAKYNREKALLESKRIDLSAPHLRATTLCQEIILLACLTAEHLPREEPTHVNEDSTVVFSPKTSPVVQQETNNTTELPTPKAEETDDVNMEYKEEEEEEEKHLAPATRALRLRRGTSDEYEDDPDLSSLPFLGSGPPTPVSELEGPRVSDSILLTIRNKLRESIEPELDADVALRNYAEAYRQWRYRVRQLESKESDSHERPTSAEPGAQATTPGAEPSTTGPLLDNPAPTTGRRGHASRWATEFDLELAMQESLRTAELEREQHEKEPKRSLADPEKEADVPRELIPYEVQRRKYIDTNFQREPGQGIFAFHYEPPEDNFTEEEHRIMVQQYRDQYAKKWGKLAEILYKEAGTSRTYKDCINHYYATKWQKEYKGKVRRRGRGGRRGGGAGRGRGAIANMERVDLPGEEGQPALTETGRPRRSAAPTFGAETDMDTTASTPTPGRLRRQTDADGTQEKVGRRGKSAREKGGRKAKAQAQPLAAAPAGSPVKVDRKLMGVKMEDEFSRLGDMTLPMQPGVQEEQMVLQADTQYHPILGLTDRHRLQPSSARPGPSSYWSVTEQTDFQKNVAHFGTDWAAIATHMGTKTQTMVKNQYLRLIDNGAEDLQRAAEEADERRNRGMDLGLPPIPTPAPKRRYESTQVTIPRTLAPTPEAAGGFPVGLSNASPPTIASGARFPSIAQAPQSKPLVPGTSYSMPDSSLVSIPQQQHSPPMHPVRQSMPHFAHLDSRRPGPRAGFFSDELPRGMEHRPPSQASNMPPSSRPLQSHVQTPMQAQPSLFRPSFQDRDHPRVEPPQDRYQSHHTRHISGEVHGRPFGPASIQSRPVTAAGSPEIHPLLHQHRHQLETAVQPPSSLPPTPHIPPRASLATPPVKEEPRHYSISHGPMQPQQPMHMPTQTQGYAASPLVPTQALQPPPSVPSAPKPVAEPRKSNLMSLLNDDQPEEPKKKRTIEQNAPSHTPTPQQQTPIAPPPPVSQPLPPRRDPYVEATTQPPYGRLSYAQQSGMPQIPGRQVVDLTREQASARRSPREEWPRQFPGHNQPPQPGVHSPHASISQPAYNDRATFVGNHRSLLAQHNHPRHNPSPPPLSAYHNSPHMHSRTPSVSGTPGQQPRHAMAASQHAQAPAGTTQILQRNPYAQVDPPGGSAQPSGPVGMRPSPHLHTSHLGGQRDVHSRNEHSQVHNGGLAYPNPQTPGEHQPGGQHVRGTSMADQFRRDPRDMHHEFDPRTGDRDMSREIQHRADALLREREPMISRSAGPPTHQDPRYQPPQDRAYGGDQQRSHTPLSRPDHGQLPLQHPPCSSLGDSHSLFGGRPRPEERFRDPFARENSRLREEQVQREDFFANQRARERTEREYHELNQREAQIQRERMMGRGPPQGPPGSDQRGTPGPPQGPGAVDWANAVPRPHGEWRR